jgi:hypothetical protein
MFTFTGEGGRGEERRPRKNPRSQKETALTKKEGESHHQKPKKRTKQNKTKKNKPTSQEERGRRRKHKRRKIL